MEVLSPANTRAEREEKLRDSVVSPEARTVEVLSLKGGRLSTTLLLREGELKPAHLPDVSVDIAAIWRK